MTANLAFSNRPKDGEMSLPMLMQPWPMKISTIPMKVSVHCSRSSLPKIRS